MRVDIESDFLESSMVRETIDTDDIFEKFVVMDLDLKMVEKKWDVNQSKLKWSKIASQ